MTKRPHETDESRAPSDLCAITDWGEFVAVLYRYAFDESLGQLDPRDYLHSHAICRLTWQRYYTRSADELLTIIEQKKAVQRAKGTRSIHVNEYRVYTDLWFWRDYVKLYSKMVDEASSIFNDSVKFSEEHLWALCPRRMGWTDLNTLSNYAFFLDISWSAQSDGPRVSDHLVALLMQCKTRFLDEYGWHVVIDVRGDMYKSPWYADELEKSSCVKLVQTLDDVL